MKNIIKKYEKAALEVVLIVTSLVLVSVLIKIVVDSI